MRRKLILTVIGAPLLGYLLCLFISGIIAVRIVSYQASVLLVDRQYNYIAELGNANDMYGYWPLPSPLPHKVEILAMAAEDHRFTKHWGIDLHAVIRALYHNYILRDQYSGASTIAMQLARLQKAHSIRRSWFAKLSESITALGLTLIYKRETVMRQYLTVAPYGNRIAGIGYATRRYLQKPLSDLSWAETALLTALPNAPGKMNLYRTRGFLLAKQRAQSILKRAYHYGWLDSLTWQQSLTELNHLPQLRKKVRKENLLHAILALSEDLEKEKQLDSSRLGSLCPMIRTSLNIALQDSIAPIIQNHIRQLRQQAAGNIAVLVARRTTGEILSYFGSDLYLDDQFKGKIDYVRTPRSTGSTLKPFIYALGMEWNGYTSATLLTDVGFQLSQSRGVFTPQNYDHQYLGPILYKNALANSRNIPAIQVLEDVGLAWAYQKFVDLGLTPDDGKADYYGLGLAIGNLYCSLFDVCQAYLALANEGRQASLTWIYSQQSSFASQIIDRDVALQIQRILSDPQARLPSFPRNSYLEYQYPVAVKTGTSRGYRDAWTLGWSDNYVVGVWIGRHDNQPMNRLSGFSAAAPVVKDIFSVLHPDRNQGLHNNGFPPPPSYEPFQVCQLTGALAHDASPYTTREYFKSGTEPITKSQIRKWLPIDTRNDLLASPQCPSEFIEVKRFYVFPEIFKDWARNQGFDPVPGTFSPLCQGALVIDNYSVEIITPQPHSRIYIDPEMPQEANVLILNCLVKPAAKQVLWLVDGKEFAVTLFPYKTAWQFKPGFHIFQAVVPNTPCKSKLVKVRIL